MPLPRFRLSLRTLCLLFIACAIAMAWLLAPLVNLRARAVALKQLDAKSTCWLGADPDPYRNQLAWLCGLETPLMLQEVSASKFTDADCQLLKLFPELDVLKLQESKVTSAGVQALAGLTKLQHLSIHSPLVDDQIAPVLTQFQVLKLLDLSETQCGDGTLAVAAQLPELKGVLSGKQATEHGLALLLKSSSLEAICLPSPQIEGTALIAAGKKPQLTHLLLRHARLSPAAVQSLANFPNLHYLDVRGTTLEPNQIPVFAKLQQLKIVAVDVHAWSEDEYNQLFHDLPAIWYVTGFSMVSTSSSRFPHHTGDYFEDDLSGYMLPTPGW